MLLRMLLFSLVIFFFSTSALASEQADLVVVIKSKRILLLMNEGKILKVYKVALGKNPVGHKIEQGDGKTPEGIYYIVGRNANSNFYKSLKISYPNEKDYEKALKLGVNPGGGIMIHGLSKKVEYLGKYHIIEDWTEGCIAVTNEEIDEIWSMVPDGTPIYIQP
ncbi:MAG: L,D-transpeptidase family protein [Thermodesulfovibrio sp.]|nr:L,D-transpeptidase family protein [Thermodesulfovibrio sp.]